MFTDSIFRTALAISLFVHLAVVVPLHFLPQKRNKTNANVVELNYIVIKQPRLAEEEEVYSEGAAGKMRPKEKEKTLSSADQLFLIPTPDSLKEEKMDGSKADRETAFLEYYNLIREKIRAQIHSTSQRSERAIVTLMFILDSGGHLQKINSVAPGTLSAAERKVIRGVKRAQPFSPFPKELGTSPVTFFLTVKFSKS